jgi:hypothetical protein
MSHDFGTIRGDLPKHSYWFFNVSAGIFFRML